MPLSREDRELIGFGFWDVLTRLDRLKENQMAFADTLAQLVAEDAEIKADVEAFIALGQTESAQIADLQAQIAALTAGAVSNADLAALQATADGLAATHAEAQAALPAAAAPTSDQPTA